MKTISFIILLFICSSVFSQTVFSPVLNGALSEDSKDGDYLSVNIFFKSYYDINILAAELDEKNASFDQRVKSVTSLLKENSSLTQTEFSLFLNDIISSDRNAYKEITYFWAVNMVNIKVKKEYVYRLSEFSGVRYMDLNTARYRIPEERESVMASDRTVDGAEPGLKTINAHKLWELGYTGRNIIFLSMDTGVFPEHPAISDNFAGNHFPYSQCWYAVRNAEPADHASSSHGTHTTGTALGMDPATNDTIGVAFNAMWIASDPVASTDDELLDPASFLGVYQWVFDPDGNPETTDDVPRVINNSWGYDYILAAQIEACEMVEAEVLIVIEAAGICSPFSAGNEGPGAGTTGFPAQRAFNEVNPMAIGALTATNTIASFSSRGPTPCIAEVNTLQIKPEVSAPGVNIRSCAGTDSYAYLQGTSMSCPHVSGALLLLAEAFPMASAYELKYALYQTAVDLGEVGEDNTFGRGLIDVFAAFNYLTLTYTPAPPVTNDYDLKSDILSPNVESLCPDNSNLEIQILVSNLGMNAIDTFSIQIFINELIVCDTLIEIIIDPAQDYTFTSLPVQLAEGKNFIHCISKPFHEYTEFDRFNNAVNQKIYVLNETDFPVYENFEMLASDLSDSEILVINQDFKNTWTNLIWGDEDQFKAMGVNFLQYGTRAWQEDYAILPQFTVPDDDSIYLEFYYAYKNRLVQYYQDSLIVEISTDCGANFNDILFANGGQNMATVDGNAMSVLYKPVDVTEFDTVRMSLDDYRTQDVVIRFRSKNDTGSVLYIDEISVKDLSVNAVLNAIAPKLKPVIYPNPAEKLLYVDFEGDVEQIKITDICGKQILSCRIEKGTNQFDLSGISSGLYFVHFERCGITEKLVVE